MLRTVSKSGHFEDEARKLVNEQLIASGQRRNPLLRRKSKLTPTDTGAITAALNNYVATKPTLPEGMVTALVGLLESTTSDPYELTKQMNDLLISNAQCGSPYIVAALAKRAEPDVLGSVLSGAVRSKDTELVSSLLDVGADPKYLDNLEIIQLIKLNAWTFSKMQSIHPISEDQVQSLCRYAIENNDVDALAALINGRMDTVDTVGQPFTSSDRDALVLLVVKSEIQNILPLLEKLATRTTHWPLEDASILRIALENTQADYLLQTSIFECLFTRFQMPESFANALDLEFVFHRCLQNGRYDLVSMMRSSNVKVPANIVAFICENELLGVLDELLKGEIEIPFNIWSYTPSLMRNGSAAMIEALLNYMFQHYVEIPDKEQLFMQCISSGQTHLITRLIDMGVDMNYNAGEPLRTAILAGNIDLIKLMLEGQLSVNTIEYGLLVASLIQPNLQVQMFELLLETGLPRFNIVNHLLLIILCDSSVDYDQTAMECLLMYILVRSRSNDVAVRDYLNPRNINACLVAKQEVQRSIKYKHPILEDVVQRLDFEMCQILLPSDDPQDDQNEFCNELPYIDNLLEHFSLDAENMPLRLFEKHILECSEYIGRVSSWPLGISNLLLGRMSPTAKKHQSIYDCMSIAIDFAQFDLFKRLLNSAEFSIEGFRTLQPVQMLSNKELMYSILDHLNSLNVSTDDYHSVVMPWFIHTCKQRQLTNAISLCTKSQYKLCITPAIEYIKVSIKEDINLPNISRLLRHTTQSQDDLELLWAQAFRSQTVCHLDRIRLIMRAGYRGSKINKVIAREIALSPDTTMLSTIFDNWQVPNPTGAVPTFDYHNHRVRPASKPYINEIEDQYHDILADTLSLAITSQRPECCTLLLEKGAPLVYKGKSLIQKAVECGINVPLNEDTILNIIFSTARRKSDVQPMLDFTLLQAAIYDRSRLVTDLIQVGASPLAFEGQCWYSALQKSDNKFLKTLLSADAARNNLAIYFQGFLSGLATRVADLDDQCAIFLKLHNAGFTNKECFDWAFSVLCDTGLLTPDRAQVLFQCGATADHRRLLQYSLRNGDAGTFHSLVATCDDHEIIQEVFLEACRKMESGEDSFFNSNDPATSLSVMEILFQFQIKQEHLNSVFESLVKRTASNHNLLPVLHALLRAGARFDVSSGEAFGRCYMLDDLQLMSQVSKANAPIEARSQALKYLLSEALPIPNLLRSKDKEGYRIGIPHAVLLDLIGFMFNEGVASSNLIHSLFSCIKVDSNLAKCESNCADQLETLLSFVINTTEGFDDKVLRMEQISVVLGWVRAVGKHWPCKTPEGTHTCSLSDEAFKRLFLQSCGKGLFIVVKKMIELDIDVNFRDSSNHSALFLATQSNQEDLIDLLIAAGASPDDGSLHVAVSQQNHAAISALLAAGHNSQHCSDLFDGATPLGVLMQDAHVDEEFTATLTNVLDFIYNLSGAAVVTRAVTATLPKALSSEQAFELIGILIAFFGLHEDVAIALRDAEIIVGRVTYSALSLVRHWDDARLEDEQRELLAAQFESFDVQPCLYAADGEQPPNATGMPEHLQRKHAFNTKECAICGDKANSEHEVYARLTPECEGIHSWDDDIICAECLKTYLETRMFPHDDEHIKYKFPSTKVFCWAPKCTNTPIGHHLLRELVDDGVFMIYDNALFQQECNSGSSMVKCATQDCPGAIWVDDEDRDQIKIFFCPVCNDNTCMECNDLYEKHDNQPCPAGAQARDDARKKAEEEATEEAMKNEKSCPKCGLKYFKFFGCDHIICGKNVYDNRVDKGCRYEFCNVCFGAWPNGHTRTCGLRG